MGSGTCLVTGVAGFIGSHLAEHLISEGYSVVGVDCFTDYYPRQIKKRNLEHLRNCERFHFVEADLLELDLESLLRGETSGSDSLLVKNPGFQAPGAVEYVFHLAAQAGVRASWGSSFEVYSRLNILTTQRLLEAAKGLPLKKFVYASSSSVYGDAEALPTPEDVIPRPHSPYGVSKLAGEHLCMLYWRNYRVPAVALRYFTVYGPRQRPDMAFHRFINCIIEKREITVFGDGEQTRDFTYVEDAVGATMQAAFGGAEGQPFNIGGGSRVTVNHVILLLEQIIEAPARVRYLAPGKGDVRHTSADTQRAERLLSYAPRFALADGLRREAEWLLSGQQ